MSSLNWTNFAEGAPQLYIKIFKKIYKLNVWKNRVLFLPQKNPLEYKNVYINDIRGKKTPTKSLDELLENVPTNYDKWACVCICVRGNCNLTIYIMYI